MPRDLQNLSRNVLILLGALFVMNGANVISYPLPDAVIAMDPAITAHLSLLGVSGIGWLFVTVGALTALLAAFRRYSQAYLVMQFVCVFWGALFLVSWAETGYWRAIFPAASYAMFVGVLHVVSRSVVIPKPLVEKLTTPTGGDHGGA